MLLNPEGTFLYVTDQGIRNTGDDTVAVFRVEARGIAAVPGSPFQVGSGGIAVGMATTRRGAFLLTANYPPTRDAVASVGVFAVGANASLSPTAGSPFAVPTSTLSSVATYPPPVCRTTSPER